MSNISREDYDTVVAGLITQANLESEAIAENEAVIKSGGELIDQLLGEVREANERLHIKTEVLASQTRIIDLRDQRIDHLENEVCRLADMLNAADKRDKRRAQRRSRG